MTVNGRAIHIPASAAQVLRRVRKATIARWIWIDAICIDQSNVAERGHQVGMMRDIYAQGSQNIVYLGESDKYTDTAIEAADLIMIEMLTKSAGNVREFLYENDTPRGAPGLRMTSVHHQEALCKLYSRPWFSRLWVLQEAAVSLSNICIYGEHTVLLYDLLAAAMYLHCIHESEERFPEDIWRAGMLFHSIYNGYNDELRNKSTKRELSTLLYTSRSLLVSVPQDRVFALLGLMDMQSERYNAVRSLLLDPDYTRSTEKVVIDASRAALVLDGMHLFRVIDHQNQAAVLGKDLPSWVLSLDSAHALDQEAVTLPNQFTSSRHLPKQKLSMISSETLTIEGLVIGRITATGPVGEDGSDWKMTNLFVRESAEVADCFSEDSRGVMNLQTFARTLIAGMLDTRHHVEMGMPDGFISWLSVVEADSHTTQHSVQVYDQAFANACNSRRIFRTESRLTGLGPRFTEPGDKVVIFYDSPWPSIIRPAEDGVYHHFVGNCYVDGMTDGEAAAEFGVNQCRHQVFHLR